MMSSALSARLAVTKWAVFAAISVALIACSEGLTPGSGKETVTNVQPVITVVEPTITPSLAPAVAEVPATSAPAPIPTATEVPVVRLYVPSYLKSNAQEAFLTLESKSPGTWRWLLVDSAEDAEVALEDNDSGVPAGSRAIALTVPFDMLWDSVSYQEAENIISEGHQDVQLIDWAEMPVRQKALRVDGLLPSEADYPIQKKWSLIAKQGFDDAAQVLGPYLSQYLNDDPLVKLTAVGDLMMDRAIGYALQNGDLSFPFAAVNAELADADITVGNLESALGDVGEPVIKSYTFQAPPAAANALSDAGFDLVTLANNHAMDYGPDSLLQALQLLEAQGIATLGAGSNALSARQSFTIEHEGLTISFLGYVDVPVEYKGFDTRSWEASEDGPGLAWADADHIHEDVVAAKRESDLVIVLLHSGYEYVETPSPEQTRAAHAAVEAGADLVIGHHAHILQGVEFLNKSVIFYGLGNFAFEIDGDPTSVILHIWLDADGVRQFELVPAIIESGGRPRLATSWEAPDIRQRVYYLSRLLNH